ncbi:hypothetical protein SUGI_0713870 [Cryptomeria japonica]|nr:hypothetical protein SUGI_0713870 [Cryptomeria japonica]
MALESAQSPTTSISPQCGNFNNPSALHPPMSPQSEISDGTISDMYPFRVFPTISINEEKPLEESNLKIEEKSLEESSRKKEKKVRQQPVGAVKLPRGMDPKANTKFRRYGYCRLYYSPSKLGNPPSGMDPDLLNAARFGDLERLEKLSKPVPCVFSEMTPGGETVLHIAARKGHQKFVDKLLELPGGEVRGGNKWQFLREKDREGNTALHVAAIAGNATIVESLVQKDRDLALETNKQGETALFKAAEEGHAEAFKILLAITLRGKMKSLLDGQTPLHRAFLKPNKGMFLVSA